MAEENSHHPFESISTREKVHDYAHYNPYQSPGYITVQDYLTNLVSGLSRQEIFSDTTKSDWLIVRAYSWLLATVLDFFGIDPILKHSLNAETELFRGITARTLQDHGFIGRIDRIISFSDIPKFYGFVVTFAKPLSDGHDMAFYEGNGVAFQPTIALSKAVGEAIERRTMITYNLVDTYIASLNEMRKRNERYLDLYNIEGFSLGQRSRHARLKFDETTKFHWVRGKELATNKDVWIPAQMVFWNYNLYKAEEPLIREPITNGDSGMFSKTEAILNGIYEIIERDAFLVFWLNRIAPPKINPASISNSAIQGLLSEIDRYGFEVRILDITTEFKVPAYAVILVDRVTENNQISPAAVIGAAAHADPLVAVEKALIESMACYTHARIIKKEQNTPTLTLAQIYDRPEICGREERILFWTKQGNLPLMDFFLNGQQKPFKPASAIASKDTQLRELLYKFQQQEYPAYVYEPKLPNFITGYHVVKVIIPHLQPMYLNESHRPDGGKRLREAPTLLGRKPAEIINTLPHPFP